MFDSLQKLLSPAGLIPHGVCLTWRPDIFWSQVVADGIIAFSYFTIPIALIYFVVKRRDLQFRGLAVLFSIFIISCGLTHVFDIVTLWYPFYGIDTLIKIATAIVSLIAAIAIWLIMPEALLIPTYATLQNKNRIISTIETTYRAYFDQAYDGMGMVDPFSQRILDANEAWCKMLGYTREELLQLTITELEGNIPQDTAERVNSIRKRGWAEFETPMFCKDGCQLTVFVAAKQVEIDGQPRLLGTVRDITKQKQAENHLRERENLLRESQQLLEGIVEHIPIMVFVKRASDLQFVLFNRAGENLLGYSRNELLGKGNYDLWPQEQGDWFTAADREVLSTRAVTEIAEEPIKTATGETRYLHTWKVAIGDKNGDPEYLLGISVDITQQKNAEDALRESEEFLKAIYDNVQAAVFVVNIGDQDGFTYGGWNRKAALFTGIESSQAIGRTPDEVFGTVIGQILRDNYTRCLREGAQVYEEQFSLNGDYWLLTTITPLRNKHGDIYKIIGLAADISTQKRTELQLIEARKQAEAANIAKSRFLATISHEIRTPMNGILGMAQMLSMPGLREYERQDYARTILTSGKMLLTLLNDVLDLSNVEAGKIRLDQIPTKPSMAIAGVRTLFAEAANLKSLQITSHWLGPDIDYFIDPYRIHQMLSNLVSNALKFTDKGSITIEAMEVERNGETATLQFTVSDTGIGIPEEMRHLIFEPFSQVDSSITRQYGGSGLGLSIVRRLARVMDGDVGFESEVGKGSRFWLRIRANVVDTPVEHAEHVDHVDHVDHVGQDAPAQLCNILVAEDNQTNCAIIEAFLRHANTNIFFVDNGQKAVDAIASGASIDLIFMDLRMPVMDGYAATTLIRQWELSHNQARHPILALTSDAFEKDRQRCLAVGMDDVITKPFSMETIKEAVRKWAQTAQSQASASVKKVVDESLVIASIGKLIPLLEEKEFDTIGHANALQEMLAGTELAVDFYKTHQLIKQCNFDLALRSLHAIIAAKGWKVSAHD